MIGANFYPGPSRVVSKLPEYYSDACNEGIVSINHRSDGFAKLMHSLKTQLYSKLEIPTDHEVIFASSATECWEIIAQSLIIGSSHHIYNGSFGEKWYSYTKKIIPKSTSTSFGLNEGINAQEIHAKDAAILCITQNETSNGTHVPMQELRALRAAFPDKLLAVDATSSMAGVVLDFSLADVWYASVQKCFGMPAGLAIMVLSPRAVEIAKAIGDDKYYNSLLFVLDNYRAAQAPYTPNVVSLYLMMRILKDRLSIGEVDRMIQQRHAEWQAVISKLKGLNNLVQHAQYQSPTVIALEGLPETIQTLKSEALAYGIVLGNGYGDWKHNTLRIANFPAIEQREINYCQDFLLKKYGR